MCTAHIPRFVHYKKLKNMCTAHILRPREYMLSLKRLGRENTTLSALAGKLAQQVLAVTLGKSAILPRFIKKSRYKNSGILEFSFAGG